MSYESESSKVRSLPEVMKYVVGDIIDIGCGHDKITPEAIGWDGRAMDGVDIVADNPYWMFGYELYDTVFSSHFLEHLANPYGAIAEWRTILKQDGYLVLYLPDGDHYDNKANEEHMQDIKYDPFLFWFRRSFCGEGKDFKGNPLPKLFEIVSCGTDYGERRYSFYIVAKKV